jgi:hypothetical protein
MYAVLETARTRYEGKLPTRKSNLGKSIIIQVLTINALEHLLDIWS